MFRNLAIFALASFMAGCATAPHAGLTSLNREELVHDDQGRIIEKKEFRENGALASRTEYTYSTIGSLVAEYSTHYRVDGTYSMTEIIYYLSPEDGQKSVKVFDQNGTLLSQKVSQLDPKAP